LLESGRSLDVRGLLLSRVLNTGMLVNDPGTSLTLTDVVIEDTVREVGVTFAAGLPVLDGPRVEARRLIVARNDGPGIVSSGSGTEVTLADVVVLGIDRAAPRGAGGFGVAAQGGARLEADRLFVSEARQTGVLVAEADTVASLTNTVVEKSYELASGRSAPGITVQDGGSVEASRVVLSENQSSGIFVNDPGSEATLADVVLRDTNPDPGTGAFGRGMGVESGGSVHASRLLVLRNRDLGILVGGEGAAATLIDVAVSEMMPRESTATRGRGIGVQDGAVLDVSRLLVSESRDLAVYAAGPGAAVTMADVVIRDTLPQQSNDGYGRALAAGAAARIDGERVSVDGAYEIGLQVTNGGIMDLRDVTVAHIERSACHLTTCPSNTFAYGAAALSATMRLDRFQILDAAICGVFVAPIEAFGEHSPLETDPSLDIISGVVADSEDDACVQVVEYDFDRLQNDVDYENNGINLDTTSLPVPSFLEGT